jgi:hypothetical protein
MSTKNRWDFFIAHSGSDKSLAEELYDNLILSSKVFLDCRCLDLGDNWDVELTNAQHNSLITVVLISHNTDESYYEREEIAAAIALSRDKNRNHRVIPIYIGISEDNKYFVPYGLRLKHGINLDSNTSLSEIAIKLLSLLDKIKFKRVSAFLYGNYIMQLTSPNLTSTDHQLLLKEIKNLPGLPVDWGASISGNIDITEILSLIEKIAPDPETDERKALWLAIAQRTLENELKRKEISEILGRVVTQFNSALVDIGAPVQLINEIMRKVDFALNDGLSEGIEDEIVPLILAWL